MEIPILNLESPWQFQGKMLRIRNSIAMSMVFRILNFCLWNFHDDSRGKIRAYSYDREISCSYMFYYPFLVVRTVFLEELKCARAQIGRNSKFDQSLHTSTLLNKVNNKKG